MAGPVFKNGEWIGKGNLVEQYMQGFNVRVKIYDGALVAQTRDDPKVQAILERIARIGLKVAEEAHMAGREF